MAKRGGRIRPRRPINLPGGRFQMKSFCLSFLVLLILLFIMMLVCGGK
jgi:uncharacterized membrane protein